MSHLSCAFCRGEKPPTDHAILRHAHYADAGKSRFLHFVMNHDVSAFFHPHTPL